MSAQRIHGITPAMLHGQPQPAAVFAAFRAFIGQVPSRPTTPLRHVLFAKEFSGWAACAERVLCTLEISRRRFRRLPNYRLETVAGGCFGPRPQDTRLHRALGDARLVARVWWHLGGEMNELWSWCDG